MATSPLRITLSRLANRLHSIAKQSPGWLCCCHAATARQPLPSYSNWPKKMTGSLGRRWQRTSAACSLLCSAEGFFKRKSLDCLRQQDEQFELRFRNIAGHESRQAAALGHRFPRHSGLIQAEILIVKFHGNRRRRSYRMCELNARQRLAHQLLDLGRRTNFNQLRHFLDQVSLIRRGADRQVEFRSHEISVVIDIG